MRKRSKATPAGHRTAVIKHHHAKPYRKRHYALLSAAIILAFFLIGYSWHYQDNVNRAVDNAKNFVSDLFSNDNHASTISSSYGYSLRYNQNQLYASGIDGSTGDLYLGSEMQTVRPYTTVRLSQGSVLGKTKLRSIEVQYYLGKSYKSLADEQTALVENSSANSSAALTKVSSETAYVGSQQFLKTSWKSQPKNNVSARFASYFQSYSGILNGKPLVIKLNNGFSTDYSWADTILNSVSFGPSSSGVSMNVSAPVSQKTQRSLTLLDRILMAKIAEAAAPQVSPSEKNSALYSPAVVKIYNVYCMDILLDSQLTIKDACDGVSGSGFFVSSDGYIATNGHVATANPKDLLIYDAFAEDANGNDALITRLINKAGIKDSDLNSAKTVDDAAAMLVDMLYNQIPGSSITTSNSVVNLLVDLNEKQPNTDELLKLTDSRQKYTEQDSIKQAELKVYDYRVIDGIKGFKASDVAIVKIPGSDYPVVKLGSISNLSQGSNLSILGFPGNASDNGLVDSTQSKVTLTSGKVSSIKNASGSSKKLIETDTTIGHGNSGGPVMDDEGDTVGIATYTADGSGSGDGVFNYIRDIQDLKDLAAKSSITFDTQSKSQDAWDKAINLFYTAHYSKSLKDFAQAKTLYPQNSRVDEFVAEANQRIKDGEDVKDFPVIPVAIGAGAALLALIAAVVMIRRHKRTHEVYKAQVASGGMTPIAAGAPPQQVSYDPAAVPTAKNVFNPGVIYPDSPAAGPAIKDDPQLPPK